MLQITADIFSGRSQPTWIVDDEQEARAILQELTADPAALDAQAAVQGDLGFRGFSIEALADDLAADANLPMTSYLPLRPSGTSGAGIALASRLIRSIERSVQPSSVPADALPLDAPLRDFLAAQLDLVSERRDGSRATLPDERPARQEDDEAAVAATCYIERAAYNPGFWNNDATIRSSNNCYNYASNWRTNTFAQPGRGCGQMYTAITCAEVTRAALCDGMHRRYDCFPDTERPRYLVALVVAPGPGFVDFHWYRKLKEGFWGHKPGGTAARNVDNSGLVIYDPQTADRGPYTHFCGYFYGCNSQRRRIS